VLQLEPPPEPEPSLLPEAEPPRGPEREPKLQRELLPEQEPPQEQEAQHLLDLVPKFVLSSGIRRKELLLPGRSALAPSLKSTR